MKPVGNSLWTSVVMIGSITNITSAYQAVANIVHQGMCIDSLSFTNLYRIVISYSSYILIVPMYIISISFLSNKKRWMMSYWSFQ